MYYFIKLYSLNIFIKNIVQREKKEILFYVTRKCVKVSRREMDVLLFSDSYWGMLWLKRYYVRRTWGKIIGPSLRHVCCQVRHKRYTRFTLRGPRASFTNWKQIYSNARVSWVHPVLPSLLYCHLRAEIINELELYTNLIDFHEWICLVYIVIWRHNELGHIELRQQNFYNFIS